MVVINSEQAEVPQHSFMATTKAINVKPEIAAAPLNVWEKECPHSVEKEVMMD